MAIKKEILDELLRDKDPKTLFLRMDCLAG
jgi:hypothetical protein